MRSPIETKLRDAVIECRPCSEILDDYTDSPGWVELARLKDGRLFPVPAVDDQPASTIHGDENDLLSPWVCMFSDIKVLTYRADLVFSIQATSSTEWLIVECDGHDWHDRTKQQAAYDRSRDREMMLMGASVARFTGSEIHNYPEKCAQDVWGLIKSIRDRANLAEAAFQCGQQHGEHIQSVRDSNDGVFAGTLGELG